MSETLLIRFPPPKKNMPLPKSHIAPIGEMPLPLNVILKALNCPFALKEDFFWGKPTNISITFVCQLFPIMLKCFIKILRADHEIYKIA